MNLKRKCEVAYRFGQERVCGHKPSVIENGGKSLTHLINCDFLKKATLWT